MTAVKKDLHVLNNMIQDLMEAQKNNPDKQVYLMTFSDFSTALIVENPDGSKNFIKEYNDTRNYFRPI